MQTWLLVYAVSPPLNFTCLLIRFLWSGSEESLRDYPIFPWTGPARQHHVALSSPSSVLVKTILFQNNGGGCEEEEGRKLLSNKCEDARMEREREVTICQMQSRVKLQCCWQPSLVFKVC